MPPPHAIGAKSREFIEVDERYGVGNYAPLPVVLERGEGVFVWDVDGRRYFDFLSAYSALNQGHNHPRITAAAKEQLGRLTLASRAYHNRLMGPLLKRVCELTGQDKAILMNSGAEAVETAIKAMRLWGYKVKGVKTDRAEILVAEDNFHGRTTTIVGFSSDPDSRVGFGPATPGFKRVPYGDLRALEAAAGADTVGFLVEPIQGEAGVRIPPAGYLKAAGELCARKDVLFCADEIQTGLGRTGRMFACDHEDVRPDLVVLGKALSGGLYPVSAVAGPDRVLGLFTPGTHGSTFGGNPLACAISSAALDVTLDEELPRKSAELGAHMLSRLKTLRHPKLLEARGRGLMLALEFRAPIAKDFCMKLLEQGLLAKDTHHTTVRLAPPLVITKEQLDEAFALISKALASL